MRILEKSDPVELAGRAIAQIVEPFAIAGFLVVVFYGAALCRGVL